MQADFQRGHEPDGKRGKRYRRVVALQGRPVLESDLNASVDALLGETRAATRALSCPAGSPDLGFLVTPGRLLGVLAEAQGITAAGAPRIDVDYRHRLAGRYPALHVTTPVAPATLTIPLERVFDTTQPLPALALWARVEWPVTIQVNGTPVTISPASPDVPVRVVVGGQTTAVGEVHLSVPANAEIWLFLAEQDEEAGGEPAFWVAPGTYIVDGLVLATGGGQFPAVAFPDERGFEWSGSPGGPALNGLIAPAPLLPGTRFAAYVEGRERFITDVEDPGIAERALGPAGGTSARAELLGQVKLARVSGLPAEPGAAAAAARAAFARVESPGGRLVVEVLEGEQGTDPCALPEIGGYTGPDNRLYRFQVHRGGGLSQVRIAWSRDNGSELFPAWLDDNGDLVVAAGTPLAGGDLVELLSSVTDLGDEALAEVHLGGFVPSQPAVGLLAALVAPEASPSSTETDDLVFHLVDPDDTQVPATVEPARFGDPATARLKVRRWHGVVDPQRTAVESAGTGATPVASPGPHIIEDGVHVTLSATGTYRPGDWWQYEARAGRENDNGSWRPEPHGPERRFAPLALLEQPPSPQHPVELVAWLDGRVPRPCEITADDVAFSGARVGSRSDTVQEALEELFEKPPPPTGVGCGQIAVRPGASLQAVFDLIPEGGDAHVCIHPGVWEPRRTVVVERKGHLLVTGAGRSTVIRAAGTDDAALRFSECAGVTVRDLAVEGGMRGEVADGLVGSLSVVDCGAVDLQDLAVSCGGAATRRVSAIAVTNAPPQDGAAADPGARVSVRRCDVVAGRSQVGILLLNPGAADVEGNDVQSLASNLRVEDILEDPDVRGRLARALMDDFIFGEWGDEVTDDLLVGGPEIVVQISDDAAGKPRFAVFLDAWGSHFITFTTTLRLGHDAAAIWEDAFRRNPPSRPGSTVAGRNAWLRAETRRLRGMLVDVVVNPGRTPPVIATELRVALRTLRAEVGATNRRSAGSRGIVVAGRGTFVSPIRQEQTVRPRPDVVIAGNRIDGFVQGIHVGTGVRGTTKAEKRGLSHRVLITDNRIHLRVPRLAGERHGVFAGSVFHLRITGNAVEVRDPGAPEWGAPPPGPGTTKVDGIRAIGTFGPLLRITGNSLVGTRNGVWVQATNHAIRRPGWSWKVADNAHVGSGGGVPLVRNWLV